MKKNMTTAKHPAAGSKGGKSPASLTTKRSSDGLSVGAGQTYNTGKGGKGAFSSAAGWGKGTTTSKDC